MARFSASTSAKLTPFYTSLCYALTDLIVSCTCCHAAVHSLLGDYFPAFIALSFHTLVYFFPVFVLCSCFSCSSLRSTTGPTLHLYSIKANRSSTHPPTDCMGPFFGLFLRCGSTTCVMLRGVNSCTNEPKEQSCIHQKLFPIHSSMNNDRRGKRVCSGHAGNRSNWTIVLLNLHKGVHCALTESNVVLVQFSLLITRKIYDATACSEGKNWT